MSVSVCSMWGQGAVGMQMVWYIIVHNYFQNSWKFSAICNCTAVVCWESGSFGSTKCAQCLGQSELWIPKGPKGLGTSLPPAFRRAWTPSSFWAREIPLFGLSVCQRLGSAHGSFLHDTIGLNLFKFLEVTEVYHAWEVHPMSVGFPLGNFTVLSSAG